MNFEGYKKEIKKFNTKYAKEALKEPANFWGLVGFAVAAVYTNSVIPLFIGLIYEAAYISVVPFVPAYRRLVEKREKERLIEQSRINRERLIKTFSPREREAVEYLRYQKEQIKKNYLKLTGAKELPSNLKSLDQRWEDFVDLLDVYRRRKQHLKTINYQVIQNQLNQAIQAMESAPDEKTRKLQQTNVEILKRRLAAFDELERSVKHVEAQLQSIENFFAYLNDEVITISTPERFSLLDFEELSNSIALTKQMLDETSEAMGALDAHNRQLGNYQLLPDTHR
jgi:hypothetical protein